MALLTLYWQKNCPSQKSNYMRASRTSKAGIPFSGDCPCQFVCLFVCPRNDLNWCNLLSVSISLAFSLDLARVESYYSLRNVPITCKILMQLCVLMYLTWRIRARAYVTSRAAEIDGRRRVCVPLEQSLSCIVITFRNKYFASEGLYKRGS